MLRHEGLGPFTILVLNIHIGITGEELDSVGEITHYFGLHTPAGQPIHSGVVRIIGPGEHSCCLSYVLLLSLEQSNSGVHAVVLKLTFQAQLIVDPVNRIQSIAIDVHLSLGSENLGITGVDRIIIVDVVDQTCVWCFHCIVATFLGRTVAFALVIQPGQTEPCNGGELIGQRPTSCSIGGRFAVGPVRAATTIIKSRLGVVPIPLIQRWQWIPDTPAIAGLVYRLRARPGCPKNQLMSTISQLERAGSVCIYYPLLYIQIVLAGISFKPLSCLAIWRTVLVKELGLAFILQPEHRACRSPATGELLAQFNKAVVLGVVPVGPVGSRAG